MILIGQYDSPFVRRVAFALNWYGLSFEHRPYSVVRDAELIAAFNPLRKVPTLVMDDGLVLTDSFVCLDVIDEQMAARHGDDWQRLLCPRSGARRVEVLRVCGLAAGAAEKAVSLVYERVLREARSQVWTERCTTQVRDTFTRLENTFAKEEDVTGARLTHAGIMVTCALSFIDEAHPGLFPADELPVLRALTSRCEGLPELARVRQPFDAPMG